MLQDSSHRDVQRLESAGLNFEIKRSAQQFAEQEILQWNFDYDIWICGDDEITAAIVAGTKSTLKHIVKWGVGLDSIDVEAAEKNGITVKNFTGFLGAAVAELAIFYAGALCRQIMAVDRGVREGIWFRPQTYRMSGEKVLVMGYGDVGKNLVARLSVFDCEVDVVEPNDVSKKALNGGSHIKSTECLSGQYKFLFVCCPLNSQTQGLINEVLIRRHLQDGYLVNVARGGICEEAAVHKMLVEGVLAGAALDVFEVEPLSSDNLFSQLSNVLLGSHNASNTIQSCAAVSEAVIDYVLTVAARKSQ